MRVVTYPEICPWTLFGGSQKLELAQMNGSHRLTDFYSSKEEMFNHRSC